jgi:hypothetical protein
MWKEIGCTIVATRAATFDLLTTRYLADHPDATVLHLGCGMDSRVFRVDPPASVQWFDVDYPDVIDLRLSAHARSSMSICGRSLRRLTCPLRGCSYSKCWPATLAARPRRWQPWRPDLTTLPLLCAATSQ